MQSDNDCQRLSPELWSCRIALIPKLLSLRPLSQHDYAAVVCEEEMVEDDQGSELSMRCQ